MRCRYLRKRTRNICIIFTDVQELDICDKEAVWSYISEKQIDVIVNCAAYTAVDKAEDNRELAHKLNSVAPGILARAAQANNAAMIQVSTDYVFDDEGVCSWYDFTVAIHRLAGYHDMQKVSPLHTDEYPAKAPRPHYSVLDKTKIKKTFGIEVPHWERV